MVTTLVRLLNLLYFCEIEGAQRSIAFLSFWSKLTNKSLALIYSVTICATRKQRIVHRQGVPNVNWSTVVLILRFAGFHDQSPLPFIWRKPILGRKIIPRVRMRKTLICQSQSTTLMLLFLLVGIERPLVKNLYRNYEYEVWLKTVFVFCKKKTPRNAPVHFFFTRIAGTQLPLLGDVNLSPDADRKMVNLLTFDKLFPSLRNPC